MAEEFDFHPMWESLGMNLADHDMLLGAVGQMYGDMFLTQNNRPKSTSYLDFVATNIHSGRIKEMLDKKETGEATKIVGSFCVYVPEEIVLACDGIPVGLCSGADWATDKVEEHLPRNTCPLIKSFAGFKLGEVCPYIESSDLVVGENTCDGKKKMYELLADLKAAIADEIAGFPEEPDGYPRCGCPAFVKKGRDADRDALHAACDLANVYFLRQKEPRGLGHAVLRAKNFIGDEPFAVLYGDDIIFSEKPVTRQLMDTYEAYGRAAVGVKEVPRELLSKYCSMKAAPIEGSDTEFFVDDMIEKPKPGEEFSNLAILGRVLLTPEIFTILEHTAPGAGGELQLTDAMATYARAHGVTAKIFEGDRYDIGSKLGFAKANFVKALEHPETAAAFAEFVKNYRF